VSSPRGTVTRIGHVALHVRDIDRSVAFFAAVLGLRVTLREGGRAYLSCNERHHELILIASGERGYDHVALEVADLERAAASLRAAGAHVLADEDEPGVEGALRSVVPGGHVVKLFAGMQRDGDPAAGDGALKFEHVSLNLRDLAGIERLLVAGLGFRLSDRAGRMLSWLHCDQNHHGVALSRFPPVSRLHHYAWSFADFEALGRVADRAAAAGAPLVYGPGRHGPGNNHFIYFKDPDGFLIECCSDLARIGPGSDYELGREWKVRQTNLWGPAPPPAFLLAGRPLARSAARR
jgi:catechol 2,3-dioxygenase-like lactoylglutathione lyase family enzyme